MILPAMGIISEVITTHARQNDLRLPLRRLLLDRHRPWSASSSGAITCSLRVGRQFGHFLVLTFIVAIPSAIKVFNWLATLYRGSIALNAPLLYALVFLFLFLHRRTDRPDAGRPGAQQAPPRHLLRRGAFPLRHGRRHRPWPYRRTAPLVAQMFGRMYSAPASAISAALVFLGFNITFFTQFIMGMHGLPRRYYHYPPEYQTLNIISTIGSWVLAVGLVMIRVTFSVRSGAASPRRPIPGGVAPWSGKPPRRRSPGTSKSCPPSAAARTTTVSIPRKRP